MKVKHLLCGIVIAILILYILKILFHSGNGFSIGGQSGGECMNISGDWYTSLTGDKVAMNIEQDPENNCIGSGTHYYMQGKSHPFTFKLTKDPEDPNKTSIQVDQPDAPRPAPENFSGTIQKVPLSGDTPAYLKFIAGSTNPQIYYQKITPTPTPGGGGEICPGRTEKSLIGLPDDFLCIGDCDPCANDPCNKPNGKCNPDGSCSCTPRFSGSNCDKCSASYNGPNCSCLIVTNPEQCKTFDDNETCCNAQTDCLFNASNGKCLKRNASCSEYDEKPDDCNASGTDCQYCNASICEGGNEKSMNRCFEKKKHKKLCKPTPPACSASQCGGVGSTCNTDPNNKCQFSCSCSPRYYTSSEPEMGKYENYKGILEPHDKYKGYKCKSVLYAGTAYKSSDETTNPKRCTSNAECDGGEGVCDKLTYSCLPSCNEGDTCKYLTDDYYADDFESSKTLSTKEFNCTNASGINSYCPFGLVANTPTREKTNTITDTMCHERLCDPFNQNCSEVNQLKDLSTLKLFDFPSGGISGYEKATGSTGYCPSINYYELNNPHNNCFVKKSNKDKTDWCCSPTKQKEREEFLDRIS